jgi:Uma2 family endonuclease
MTATVARPVETPVTMPRYRFSIEEFERMHEIGIFDEDSPVELIRGEVVEMAAQGTAHVYCVAAINRLVGSVVGPDIEILVQSTIRLPDRSMPEPDLALAVNRGRRTLPTPPDVLLVGEVADSSLNHDRTVKLPLYAEAGIPEAWLFNVVAAQIERHTQPRQGQYHQISIASRGEQLTSTVLAGLTFDVDDVFGPEDA